MTMKKRNGFVFIEEFSDSEPIVSMIEFNGTIYLATTNRIFKHAEDGFEPLGIWVEE